MLTRREFIVGAAKVFAGGVVAASGVLAIVPKAAKPKIFHGKQARMWVNDVEITEDIPPIIHYDRMVEWKYDLAFPNRRLVDEIRMLRMLRG